MQRGRGRGGGGEDGGRMKLNFDGLEMQKFNMPVDRAFEKNSFICQVIKFIPVVIVTKMLKVAYVFVFSADDSKHIDQFEQNI